MFTSLILVQIQCIIKIVVSIQFEFPGSNFRDSGLGKVNG